MLKGNDHKKKGKKTTITFSSVLEVLIRLVFFLIYPALFATAFTGIKMIVKQLAAVSSIPWNPFVETLVILLVFTIVFGRFFCGFACAFGTYGDFIYFLSTWIRKKMKKRPLHVFDKVSGFMQYLKYVVLGAVLVLCVKGEDSLINLYSPFTTFSRLHTLKLPMNRAGAGIFFAITLGMALESRFFCRFLCPMGAVFSLMPVLPFSVIKRDRENCIKNCKACRMACPASLDIPSTEEGDNILSGECFGCGKCIRRCPRQNIGSTSGKTGWPVLLLFKAALLFAAFWFIG
ncbi:MAG: 4Fe-4S binding protein [Eubacterium sp.]|nr:4Fe-4S binding protein [Eubacterium sp.]